MAAPQKVEELAQDSDASLPYADIPTIDIGLLTSPESNTQQLHKLHSALTSWGCFQIMNHGIEPAFLERVSEVGKQFFGLPLEMKMKYSRETGGYEGYLDRVGDAFNYNSRLVLTTKPEDRVQLKYWPQSPECLRETIQEYISKVEKINEKLLKAIAMTLNLEENCFVDMYGEQANMSCVYISYPPCPGPDPAVGFNPHSDGSAFTYVLQDKEVEGLQFLKNNQWYTTPFIPGCLLVNAGDIVEIMSNGIFISPIHRVMTNTEKQRMSVVVFCSPDSNKELEPVKGVVTETRPRLFKTIKNYNIIFLKNLQQGKRAIEQLKI